ncbi:uncharacterized protein [Palaemon carinicauda]|uniref:uncharacterized protein n=1 Tax=Palaemon carinicauda TaxID=392227 RepID=UPI0035B62905
MNEILSKALKLHEASKASRLGASSSAPPSLMVDAGAMQSTFPPSKSDLDRGPDKNATSLIAANGSPIRCYEIRTLKISIMGRSYSWPFAIADVNRPLLGADFLAHHGLFVDVAKTSHRHGNLPVPRPRIRPCNNVRIRRPPTHAKFRRLPPQKLNDAKRVFGDMERMGICKKASSPSSSSLHMVKKPDGS